MQTFSTIQTLIRAVSQFLRCFYLFTFFIPSLVSFFSSLFFSLSFSSLFFSLPFSSLFFSLSFSSFHFLLFCFFWLLNFFLARSGAPKKYRISRPGGGVTPST